MFLVLLLTASAALIAKPAMAVTLSVDGSGQLLGANGVDVGGTLYDVEFVDGTCIGLYSGCDLTSDFLFRDADSAIAASEALLGQVFLDGVLGAFDSEPALTNGCDHIDTCRVATPYAIDDSLEETIVRVVAAENRTPQREPDNSWLTDVSPSSDLTPHGIATFAVWSVPVPEPGTATLVGLGLTAISIRRRSRLSS